MSVVVLDDYNQSTNNRSRLFLVFRKHDIAFGEGELKETKLFHLVELAAATRSKL